ncbi:related to insulysin precursor (metalloendopeptidase) [Cephalotrichum gorgonifer]|uniref:Related to insulysin (Metalloendopeptidase) n=1 Tax=Cephalotrichum gorgonifer TaxID=2041049 RepID=A0AAE8MZU9_9PEZI|nr:related to insulysin precursor (metalloendopeptidase) [Cephalotrichum gorgonifer]
MTSSKCQPQPEGQGSLQRTAPGSARLITEDVERPSLDDRTYRVIELANKMEVFLVHDAKADKASASMDVNVGNFSDDVEMPGMAHAVEHLLFMGTKKYPGENDYSQYLSANSGHSNAYTAATSTNYYFDLSARPANDEDPSESNPSALKGGLDRFSQFFIEPLFLESTLDRELQAVDSENKKNLQNDSWRLYQLEKSQSNPNHPYCHFSTGNLEILKTLPEEKGVNVRDKFIEFYQKHYSANRMKLCVLGREPLDVLEKWVVEYFTPVPNKDLPQNRWDTEVPLRPSELGIQCFAKPVMDSRELNLYFPFLNEEDMYMSQPSRYVGHLIGHEGPGSIMSYIKAKGWANGLSAGTYPLCPGTPSLFDCQIRLTEEGLKNYKEIIKVFFQYVALLRESVPQQWIFEEQKGLADVAFKFKQKSPASSFTMKTSELMQKPIPREWLLSGFSRLRDFDPVLIKKTLDCLRTDNFRMTVISQQFPGDWDQKEKWYGTEYRVEKIPEEFMEELRQAASTTPENRLLALHFPHKNNFIPTKLEVEKKDIKEPAVSPAVIRNDDFALTWWKKDDTFWVPKANVIISCKNPVIFATAESAVKSRLYTDLVRDVLEEFSYDAELAGLDYNVSIDHRGLSFEVSGYNDKLPVLLEHVLKTTRNLEIKDDRFDIVKERLKRAYSNWELQSSYQQVGDYLYWLNSERGYIVEEYAAELPNITAEALRQFKPQLLGQLHVELYAHGNLYKEDALRLTDMVQSILGPRPLPRTQWPIRRSLVLPPGSSYLYKKTLKDPANVNHCIEYWLATGDKGDPATRARTLFLEQVMHEPAFDQLRTKEQLGYIVFCGMRSFATTYGFRWLVQSERDPAYLESRVDAFIRTFGETLKEMGETEFESNKRSLVARLLKKLENLNSETNRHWGQISGEYYNFTASRQDAENVKALTKADILEFYQQKLHMSSPLRAKMVVQLFAQGNGKSKEKEGADGVVDGVVDGAATNGEAESTGVTLIEDVRSFKASLVASAGARPARDITEYEEIDAKL